MYNNYDTNRCDKKCDCGCHFPHPDNCELVLESFHKTVNQALELFRKGVDLESESLKEAIESIEYLKESFCVNKQGEKLMAKAERDLEQSNCNFKCNKDSCKCEKIEEQMEYCFDISKGLKKEAICLLEEAIFKLEKSAEVREKAVMLSEKYNQCIHHKDHCEH